MNPFYPDASSWRRIFGRSGYAPQDVEQRDSVTLERLVAAISPNRVKTRRWRPRTGVHRGRLGQQGPDA